MQTRLAVETRGLTKVFADGVRAVADLDLRVLRGEVYGFLGRNGAGKTTTLRLLLGLLRPTSGEALVLGVRAGAAGALSSVGAMVEAPAFYPYLSGKENLRLLARYCGAPPSVVVTAIEQAGLEASADRRFGTYSQGMRQRLGVAAAMLKDPQLLILDEPTNGLDPAGMASMRELIRALADGGRTVLLSSHLLGEVEQICDRVGVINAGSLVAEGTPAELRSMAGQPGLLIRAAPIEDALACLAALAVSAVTGAEDGLLHVDAGPDDAGEINRALVMAGVTVTELRARQPSLEEAFLELSRPEAPGAQTGPEPDHKRVGTGNRPQEMELTP